MVVSCALGADKRDEGGEGETYEVQKRWPHLVALGSLGASRQRGQLMGTAAGGEVVGSAGVVSVCVSLDREEELTLLCSPDESDDGGTLAKPS